MSLLYNNYDKLKAENNNEIAKLSGKNWDPLKRIMDYTESFDVSLFELEVIKKDMIGAAREADAQDMDLKEKIGMPEEEFCKSLIKGLPEHGRWEKVFLSVRSIMCSILVFYIISFPASGLPVHYGLPLDVLVMAFLLWAANAFFRRYVVKRTTYASGRNKKVTAGAIIWVAAAIIILNPLGLYQNYFVIRGNGWVILGILALLAALGFLANNYYWDKRSEKYNWQ